MRGCREAALRGEHLQQICASRSGRNLPTLGKNVRNLLCQLFVNTVSRTRTAEAARQKDTERGNQKCFHIGLDGSAAKILRSDAQRPGSGTPRQ